MPVSCRKKSGQSQIEQHELSETLESWNKFRTVQPLHKTMKACLSRTTTTRTAGAQCHEGISSALQRKGGPSNAVKGTNRRRWIATAHCLVVQLHVHTWRNVNGSLPEGAAATANCNELLQQTVGLQRDLPHKTLIKAKEGCRTTLPSRRIPVASALRCTG